MRYELGYVDTLLRYCLLCIIFIAEQYLEVSAQITPQSSGTTLS